DIALVLKLLALFHAPSRAQIRSKGEQYGLIAIFLFGVGAMVVTLWMQYFDNLAPCLLCWYQRICMYPIPLIAAIAVVKGQKLSDVADYILGLSAIGFLIALYQHLLQVLPSGSLIPCDASNDCAVRSVFEFGFVTIPWMALTVFAVLFVIALVGRKKS